MSTWPLTMWPPRRSPTRRARSVDEVAGAGGQNPSSQVRSSVSRDRSKAMSGASRGPRRASRATTVRQAPPRRCCPRSPRSGARTSRRPPAAWNGLRARSASTGEGRTKGRRPAAVKGGLDGRLDKSCEHAPMIDPPGGGSTCRAILRAHGALSSSRFRTPSSPTSTSASWASRGSADRRRPGRRLPRLHARSASHRGRPSLRRRPRHGAQARAHRRGGQWIEARHGACRRIALTPDGVPFDSLAESMARPRPRPVLLLCGRYEGFDERASRCSSSNGSRSVTTYSLEASCPRS